jgi:hypothetical protein
VNVYELRKGMLLSSSGYRFEPTLSAFTVQQSVQVVYRRLEVSISFREFDATHNDWTSGLRGESAGAWAHAVHWTRDTLAKLPIRAREVNTCERTSENS